MVPISSGVVTDAQLVANTSPDILEGAHYLPPMLKSDLKQPGLNKLVNMCYEDLQATWAAAAKGEIPMELAMETAEALVEMEDKMRGLEEDENFAIAIPESE